MLTTERAWSECRTASRALRRAPSFTILVLGTLSVTLGAVIAVFAIARAVLIRPLPYPDPERLVWLSAAGDSRPAGLFSLPEFLELTSRVRSADVEAYGTLSASLATAGPTIRVQGLRLSGGALSALGARPTRGRLLQAADDSIGAPRVVVLGFGFWRRQFGADPRVVGTTIRLNGERYSVVGILPVFFPMPLRNIDLVVPLSPGLDPRRSLWGSSNFLRLLARERGSAGAGTVAAELNAIGTELRQRLPDVYTSSLAIHLVGMKEFLVGDQRLGLFVLLGCVLLMQAIAFANVGNSFLMRATSTQGEIAVRRALGGSPAQLWLAKSIEPALLCVISLPFGLLIARWAISLSIATAGNRLSRLDETRMDASVVGVAVASLALATLVFSSIALAVVFRAQPAFAMRAAASGAGRGGNLSRFRATLVVAEVAMALVLMSAATSLLGTFVHLQHVDLGFRPDSTFVSRVSLSGTKYPERSDLVLFYERMQKALAAIPGVEAAGMVSVAPFSGVIATETFDVVGRESATARDRPFANYRAISPQYLSTIGARLVAGRMLREDDGETTQPVALVNQTVANRYFAGASPVGKDIWIDDDGVARRRVHIVGVVANLRQVTLDGPATNDVFVPLRQLPKAAIPFVVATSFWSVRTRTQPASFAPTFRRLLNAVDPDAASSGSTSLREYVDDSLAPRRYGVTILVIFVGLSIFLAALGVHGVMRFDVEQRRREIAVRMAFGATTLRIVGWTLRRMLLVAGGGLLLGIVGSLVAGQLIAGLLFGTTPYNPVFLAASSALILVVALVATAVPAVVAARTAPSVVLSSS